MAKRLCSLVLLWLLQAVESHFSANADPQLRDGHDCTSTGGLSGGGLAWAKVNAEPVLHVDHNTFLFANVNRCKTKHSTSCDLLP